MAKTLKAAKASKAAAAPDNAAAEPLTDISAWAPLGLHPAIERALAKQVERSLCLYLVCKPAGA